MTEEEAERVIALERNLTEWMKMQPVSVEWSIMALGISAARLICGIGALQGNDASRQTTRLLNTSIAKAIDVFNRDEGVETRH